MIEDHNSKDMSIVSKIRSGLEQGGLSYVLASTPNYVKTRVQSKISDGVYRAYNPYGVLYRSDMISKCKDKNQIWYYGTDDEFEIKLPVTGDASKPIKELIGTQKSPQSFICELHDVYLIGEQTILPRTKHGRFVIEELGTESALRSHILNTFRSFNNCKKIKHTLDLRDTFPGSYNHDYDTVINMVPRHGGSHNDYINYGHWLAEDLPRLRGYNHYYKHTGRRPDLLIKNDPPSWMISTLQLLGFTPTDWTEWNRSEASVSRFVVPKLSYVHSVGAEFQPSDRRWVSDQMKSRINIPQQSNQPERIYISRQGQDRRRVTNHDEVMTALYEYGFKSIRPEKLTIKGQICLFDQAKMIVGPSGSGLANVIFSDNSSLIEIKPAKTRMTIWHVLAAESGLYYDYTRGKNSGNIDKTGRNSDICVDINELKETVSNALRTPSL